MHLLIFISWCNKKKRFTELLALCKNFVFSTSICAILKILWTLFYCFYNFTFFPPLNLYVEAFVPSCFYIYDEIADYTWGRSSFHHERQEKQKADLYWPAEARWLFQQDIARGCFRWHGFNFAPIPRILNLFLSPSSPLSLLCVTFLDRLTESFRDKFRYI